ncbi:DUF2147 domain-containing protein [Bradyrhizobium sp.]|uniref:DUF2147 domain-containing protein n=1 Tax=Bradyrhizobium sp. TaxID=376 RepID=UPI0025C4BF45|nr:DUF2147 domain-containing protein [Bradyrhizobium sp.]MBV8917059.1 DUF2147 domain-containing protein [Bradyrhizobium sp.]
MKKLTLATALVLASTAAHAGQAISLDIDGHRIRIEAPKNCDALSCLKITGLGGINLGRLTSGRNDDDETPVSPSALRAPAPAQAPSVQASAPPTTPAASPEQPALPAPATVTSSTPAAQIPSTNHLANADAAGASTAPLAPAALAGPASAPTNPAAAAAAPAAQPAPAAAAPVPNTPLGLWATEENKGNVRIEPCGANLCGYAEKSGEKVLINMKPSDNKWVGRIHDPAGGGNYDSTIAIRGPNLLKVQGCAFGGLFCGGQTWKRLS